MTSEQALKEKPSEVQTLYKSVRKDNLEYVGLNKETYPCSARLTFFEEEKDSGFGYRFTLAIFTLKKTEKILLEQSYIRVDARLVDNYFLLSPTQQDIKYRNFLAPGDFDPSSFDSSDSDLSDYPHINNWRGIEDIDKRDVVEKRLKEKLEEMVKEEFFLDISDWFSKLT